MIRLIFVTGKCKKARLKDQAGFYMFCVFVYGLEHNIIGSPVGKYGNDDDDVMQIESFLFSFCGNKDYDFSLIHQIFFSICKTIKHTLILFR